MVVIRDSTKWYAVAFARGSGVVSREERRRNRTEKNCLTLTHTHTQIYTHTHTLIYTHTHTLIYTHTRTWTRTLRPFLPPSLPVPRRQPCWRNSDTDRMFT